MDFQVERRISGGVGTPVVMFDQDVIELQRGVHLRIKAYHDQTLAISVTRKHGEDPNDYEIYLSHAETQELLELIALAWVHRST